MDSRETKRTVPVPSVGADGEQPISQTTTPSIAEKTTENNPQLRVFSAHLHMDEATPHLHIDFVPFTTGSKRAWTRGYR